MSNYTLTPTRTDVVIAKFAALAVVIHVLEAAIPSPLPGVKPGLANVVTLLVLLRYGWRVALSVAVLRVVASSLLLGTFLSPTFLLSFGGACAALAALGAVYWLNNVCLRRQLGPIAFSATAAMAHMAAQFIVAWQWFLPVDSLLDLLPILLMLALLFGIVSGVIAAYVLRALPPPPKNLLSQ